MHQADPADHAAKSLSRKDTPQGEPGRIVAQTVVKQGSSSNRPVFSLYLQHLGVVESRIEECHFAATSPSHQQQ